MNDFFKYYRRKQLLEKLSKSELDFIKKSKEYELLKKIDKQTSNTQSVIQNLIGNFISDGAIYILSRIIKKGV